MNNLKQLFKNVISFQKDNQTDFFLGAESKYYEIQKKHGEDLAILKDRALFYYLNTTGIIKTEEGRRGFEFGINTLLDLLNKNVDTLDAQKEERKAGSDSSKKNKIKLF